MKKLKTERKENISFNIINPVVNENWILVSFDKIEIYKWKELFNTIELFEKQKITFKYLQEQWFLEVLYWWWARWWKSWLWCLWIVLNCMLLQNSRWLIWRKSLLNLKKSTLETLLQIFKWFWLEPDVDYNYNQQEQTIRFNNWSIIFLMHFQKDHSDPNFDRLWSLELSWCFLEESQEIEERKIKEILKWRLSKIEELDNKWKTIWKMSPKLFYTCNPWKNWLYTEFYKPYVDKKLWEWKIFIPSLVTDNPHISQEYIENLKTADEKTVKRLLYWDWNYSDDVLLLFQYDDLTQMFENQLFNNDNKTRYMSVDLSWKWADKTVVTIFEWWKILKVYKEDITDWQILIPKLVQFEKDYWILRKNVVIDWDGIWWNFEDFYKWCFVFHWWSSPIKKKIKDEIEKKFEITYKNLRSQCYIFLSEVVKWHNIYFQDKEYQDKIITELEIMKELDKSDLVRQVISKKDIKANLWHSPDYADSLMMRSVFDLIEEEKIIELNDDDVNSIFWFN